MVFRCTSRLFEAYDGSANFVTIGRTGLKFLRIVTAAMVSFRCWTRAAHLRDSPACVGPKVASKARLNDRLVGEYRVLLALGQHVDKGRDDRLL